MLSEYFEFTGRKTMQITPLLLSKSIYLNSLYESTKEQHHENNTIRLKNIHVDNDMISALYYLLNTPSCDLYTLTKKPEELETKVDVINY